MLLCCVAIATEVSHLPIVAPRACVHTVEGKKGKARKRVDGRVHTYTQSVAAQQQWTPRGECK